MRQASGRVAPRATRDYLVRRRVDSSGGPGRRRRAGAGRPCGGATLNHRSFEARIEPDPTTGADRRSVAGRGYRVRIEYEEPEFHRRNPHCPEAYTALFECSDAGSRREAIDMALMEFDRYAGMSRVRWRRIVRAITVE